MFIENLLEENFKSINVMIKWKANQIWVIFSNKYIVRDDELKLKKKLKPFTNNIVLQNAKKQTKMNKIKKLFYSRIMKFAVFI